MGKKQHQKDKMYITATEWREQYGGKKEQVEAKFKRLPFYCCALSLQSFEHPYCTQDGHVFDLSAIVPFIRKYGIHPITGKKLDSKQLIKLNFEKNADGKFHCPVMFKVFTESTAIVAIKVTGNVYCREAIQELNLKPKNMVDLITSEPFTKADIITIQDPHRLEKQDMSSYFHIKQKLKLFDEEDEKAQQRSDYTLKTTNTEAKATLEELNRTYNPTKAAVQTKDKTEDEEYLPKFYKNTTVGEVSRGFTSTAAPRITANKLEEKSLNEVLYERVKKKGYVRVVTSLGEINLELHCDQVPQTCHNFLLLCSKHYYDSTIFHRSIKNFMIQGGDPTGTGMGGESAFGSAFPDQFKPNLTHTGRGMLSMANSGPNTNTSQFFITYRSAPHLNNKHTLFGRVVGGLKTLDTMEKVETGAKDRPKEEIKLISMHIFVDPFVDLKEEMINEEKKKREQAKKKEEEKALGGVTLEDKITSKKTGVGKYIGREKLNHIRSDNSNAASSAKRTKILKSSVTGFSDFSSW